LSYLANTETNRQTDKQTKSGKNITSLAEVINWPMGEQNEPTCHWLTRTWA